MPIRQYLEGHRFDAETVRLMGVAFAMAVVTLQQRRRIDLELAKAGERDPERLCDGALKATQPMAPVLIRDLYARGLPESDLRRRVLTRAFARASDRFPRHLSHLQPRRVMTLMK
jgi:hypothetical protein